MSRRMLAAALGCMSLMVVVSLVLAGASGAATSFTNATSISIPDSGLANPYPSTINVPTPGTIQGVTVTLNAFTHTAAADIDILLVGPSSVGVILMSDVGVGHTPINGSVTFADGAPNVLPAANPGGGYTIGNASYQPINYSPSEFFPGPAPAGSFGSALSAFNGTPARGNWSLYVLDDSAADSGAIGGGWTLNLTIQTTPADVLPLLKAAVSGVGEDKNLAKQVKKIEGYITAGDAANACSDLKALIKYVNSLLDNKNIKAAKATEIIDLAKTLQTTLGC